MEEEDLEYVPNFGVDEYDVDDPISRPQSLKPKLGPQELQIGEQFHTSPYRDFDFEYEPNFEIDAYAFDQICSQPQTSEPNDEKYGPTEEAAYDNEQEQQEQELSRVSAIEFEYEPNLDVDACDMEQVFSQLSAPDTRNQHLEHSPEYVEQHNEDDHEQERQEAELSHLSLLEFEYIPNFEVDAFVFDQPDSQSHPQDPKTMPTEKNTSKQRPNTATEANKTPINTRPVFNDVHAKFSMKILKKTHITPMPNYKSMLDEELNDHLNKYGFRPMGRKRAIEELTKIYESTHPLVDGSTTPTRDRVWPSVSNYVEKQPKKKPAVSRKRPAPPEFDEKTPEASKPLTLVQIAGEVLRWLRMPQNNAVYRECMALKSIPLVEERLIEVFEPLLREKSISRDAFVRILDHLHITYSDKRGDNNTYHH